MMDSIPGFFLGRCGVKKLFPLCFVLGMALILAGCAPEESLFPLFTNTDKLLDQKLLGERRIWSGKDMKVDDKPGDIVFSPSDYGDRYEVKLTEFNAEGGSSVSEAHLVKFGDCLFSDFGTPDMNHWTQVPYPAVEAHVFGRLSLEKDRARIDFLSDDWVKKQIEAGKLSLQFLPLSGHTLWSEHRRIKKICCGTYRGSSGVFGNIYPISEYEIVDISER